MAETRKSYGEGCLAAHALDVFGDRWSLLIVRELMFGPKRFGAIRARLPGIATNMLARRLDDLEAGGIVIHRDLPPPASVPVYELTAEGYALRPVLVALCHWGAGSPGHDHRLPISPTALMISMQAMMRAGLRPGAGDHQAGFTLDDERFLVTVTDGGIDTQRTDSPAGRVHFTATPNDMAAVVYGPQTLAQSLTAGLVRVDGDIAAGQPFIDLFRLERPQGKDTP